MDWEGIRTAYLDRERQRLGLPSRQALAEKRAAEERTAAMASSQLETAGLQRQQMQQNMELAPELTKLRSETALAQAEAAKARAEQGPRMSESEYLMSLTPEQANEYARRYTSAHPKTPPDTTYRDATRLDRSYQFNAGQLNTIAKPYRDQAIRLANLQSTVQQKTPQADALVAPELLTVMAGGQGSGLRMNEAEIARIVGGRSNWESIKAAVNRWRGPGDALSITDAQRGQIQSLLSEVSKRSQAHQQLISSAEDEMLNASSPEEHRRIMAKLRHQLATADAALGTINDLSASPADDVSAKADAIRKKYGLGQ